MQEGPEAVPEGAGRARSSQSGDVHPASRGGGRRQRGQGQRLRGPDHSAANFIGKECFHYALHTSLFQCSKSTGQRGSFLLRGFHFSDSTKGTDKFNDCNIIYRLDLLGD